VASPIDVARQLVGLAGDDELMARSLLPVEGVTDAGVGFHCQQAVEKALKAALASKDVRFPFVHNLGYLRELCENSGIDLPSTLNGMEYLTPFAATMRYGSSEPVRLDRDKALAWAAEAVAWARSLVEEADGQPKPTTEPGDSSQTPTPPS
jgi:HEPN domain-containing protein